MCAIVVKKHKRMQARNERYKQKYKLKHPNADADAIWSLEQDPDHRSTMTTTKGSRFIYVSYIC